MPRPSHISDASFNEVYGTMHHAEDRRKTHYRDSRDHYNNVGPVVNMPYHGHAGDSPDPGTVTNIGFASGNVNTGMVYGTLNQREGRKRAPKRRPPSQTLPSPFPPTRSSRPPSFPHVTQSKGVPYYGLEEVPLYEEPRPSRSHHSREQGPPNAPHYYRDGGHLHSQQRERHGQDDPDYFGDDHGYANHGNRRQTHYYQEEPQHDSDWEHRPHPQQAPPMKSRNSFRNHRAESMPVSQPSAATSRTGLHRAATTEYTSSWVADTSGYNYAHLPPLHATEEQHEDLEDDDTADIQLSLRSPSEYSSSSSSSPSRAPDYWSRAASRSSGATSHSRFSPVQEEYPNGLYARKPRSRSSTPGLC